MQQAVRFRFLLILPLLALFGLALSGPASATEYIQSFRSEIEIARNGGVTVTELITVNAEGRDIRRGIFRDFPLTMLDDKGRHQTVGFDVLSVERDGAPEKWHTETISGGIRIYFGSQDVELRPGRHAYALTYRTDRQIRYFPDHDEFYWNVTGNGWKFAIQEASTTISLPDGVQASNTTFFTGPMGSTAKNARANGTPANPRFVTTRPLAPGEGLTIAVAMPKGSIAPPSDADRRAWFLRDYLGLIVSGIGLVVVIAYYLWFWARVGRDPPKGVVVPRWDAPDGLSPALVNYVDNRGFSGGGWTAFSATMIDLAVRGFVRLEDLSERIVIRRTDKAVSGPLASGEAVMLRNLEAAGGVFVIDKANGTEVQGLGKAFRNAIETEHRGKYYRANLAYVVVGVLISLLCIIGIVLAGGIGPEQLPVLLMPAFFGGIWGGIAVKAGKNLRYSQSLFRKLISVVVLGLFGIVALIIVGLVLVTILESLDDAHWPVLVATGGIVLSNILFFFLMGAPTPLGRRLMDGVEGLRLYLTVAERDRMNMAGAPAMSPQHFETLLPYAVALGVEKPWSQAFETWLAASVASAAAYDPYWYSGGNYHNIGSFSSSMASTIASTLPQPQSSSSSGFSGGSSGGGGGGGGGGGW
ncbi:DUF2207 domain-containing protein [Rhizobium oryzicola]|uniref:DUF2207 domain-containing protein n=1 Tax=Rhizobium oryzicola TaxID=1232668 RepID=A0ABT8ST65_9HYPH|nr:DUF2207 domain-containing protein [Rhizobium oryzicola]MDO1581223.1 DUF2207 domain-containing protein [Rhizobium oryzicola]